MVKKIYLEKSEKDKMDYVLGKFLDDDCYDTLLTEDADVYEPLTPLQIMMGEEHSEKNILLKFRKNVFSKEMTDHAYKVLRDGATMSDNRGIAAGIERNEERQILPDGNLGGRKWVTERQKAVIEYLIAGSPHDIGGKDQLQRIYNDTPNKPLSNRGVGKDVWGVKERVKSGSIWIVEKAKDFDFDAWYNTIEPMGWEARKHEALRVFHDLISSSTYGQGVRSGVAGFFDRYPRIPFCRETGNFDATEKKYKYRDAIPLLEAASEIYKRELPQRWQGQMDEALKNEALKNEALKKGPDSSYRIGETPYTTLTINRDFRTAAHRDVGDLCESGDEVLPPEAAHPRGFSNLLVLDNGKKYDGFYLCFPEYRVAADIRAGDLIMMNAHRIHSNTPPKDYEEGSERMSIVMYYRTEMASCGSKTYENLRKQFVYYRRDTPGHPGHKNEDGTARHKWNGISPGMFHSAEWGTYLKINGLHEEGDAVLNNLK
jgi:hypothetical protein